MADCGRKFFRTCLDTYVFGYVRKYRSAMFRPQNFQKFEIFRKYWWFWPKICYFSPKWTQILTFKVAGGLKVSANHKKIFFWPKYVKLCPATENRPEISISGHILVIFKKFWIWQFRVIFRNFDFESGQRAEISGELSQNFFGKTLVPN